MTAERAPDVEWFDRHQTLIDLSHELTNVVAALRIEVFMAGRGLGSPESASNEGWPLDPAARQGRTPQEFLARMETLIQRATDLGMDLDKDLRNLRMT